MNNRQANNGRRRGRGGQQRQGGNPNQGNGSRIDNRARGNAAQLLEKYKNLARDAQLQGDRVNTEYYLQFADHYFRVVNENRARLDDGSQQRRQREDSDDEDDFEFEAEGQRDDQPRGDEVGTREDRAPRQDRGTRDAREDRGNREERSVREDRGNRDERVAREDRGNRDDRGERRERRPVRGNGGGYPVETGDSATEAVEAVEQFASAEAQPVAEEAPRPRRRTTRRDREAEVQGEGGIDAAILPPALGVSAEAAPVDEPAAEEKPKRRRTRRDAEAPAA
ncbi:DUF4167 domain-containing protein [Sphingomonas sp. HF-S3]|uniref:DUF4167 domain-containing protein n=1 Tax=Sphingomonas rustica TaxID=3103142 RepID=A0ABV0BBY3_9SPHN